MKAKDLIALMQQSFSWSGDQYSSKEQIEKIRWDLFKPTDLNDREPNAYKVGVSVRQSRPEEEPSYFGGVCWLVERDGDIYTGWETVHANTLIPDDGSKFYKWIKNKVQPRKPDAEFTMIVSNPYWDYKNPDGIPMIISHHDGDSVGFANTSWAMFCDIVTCICHEYPELDIYITKEIPAIRTIKIFGYSVGAEIQQTNGISKYKLTITLKKKL